MKISTFGTVASSRSTCMCLTSDFNLRIRWKTVEQLDQLS